jgi:hypothetical protein
MSSWRSASLVKHSDSFTVLLLLLLLLSFHNHHHLSFRFYNSVKLQKLIYYEREKVIIIRNKCTSMRQMYLVLYLIIGD